MDEKLPLLNHQENKIWCPLCKDYVHFIKAEKAARLADVSRRTIYRYVEEGRIYSRKIAGTTLRVCSNCLLKQDDEI